MIARSSDTTKQNFGRILNAARTADQSSFDDLAAVAGSLIDNTYMALSDSDV